MFAEIIVPLKLPNTYCWSIPEQFQSIIKVGMRAEVSLRKKKYAGIIKRILVEKPKTFNPIPIENILDDSPILYQQQLDLWSWMADYYMSCDGEVMNAAMPANLKLTGEGILVWNESLGEGSTEQMQLTDDEFIVSQALEIKRQLNFTEVQQLLDSKKIYPVIKRLIDKQVCHILESLKERYTTKKETFVFLFKTYEEEDKLRDLLNNFGKAAKQLELLLSFLHLSRTKGLVTQTELLKKSNSSLAQLQALVEKGILVLEKKEIDRIDSSFIQITKEAIALSEPQEISFNAVQKVFLEKNVCLLHGVTASGKTLIYIKLIESYLQKGKQVLFLLPEIALTVQIIRKLQSYFGNKVAVYHSKFNPNERVEIWQKTKENKLDIILGARSALFLPFKTLGLIIVDEEHDSSYKQSNPAPRYNGRDCAIYLAHLYGAKVLLGSATPSIESYHNGLQGKYGLVSLLERYQKIDLPTIDIIDMKKVDMKNPKQTMLSAEMINCINESLSDKKQVILFQNRRGYSPFILCKTCGWIPYCNHCNVTLTFHKSKNKLSCHYCGTSYPILTACAACGGHDFEQKKFGTEKIEEAVAEIFPTAKVARMDLDTIKGKKDHDTIIQMLENRKIDILVGTQMVVKGFDFEHVNLVGIVDGDSILNFTDFRVNEKAFQLIEQVSGRAGRRDGNGKLCIQVSNTQHPLLRLINNHDYMGLYQFEIEARKYYHYPPFTRMIKIQVKHVENPIAAEAALLLVNELSREYKTYIMGPAQPSIDRIRNQYIWEILIRLPKDNSVISNCKKKIVQESEKIRMDNKHKRVVFEVDVDPL